MMRESELVKFMSYCRQERFDDAISYAESVCKKPRTDNKALDRLILLVRAKQEHIEGEKEDQLKVR